METLLHTQVPTTAAFSTIGGVLALVQIEVETHTPIVVVHADATLVLKLSRQEIRCPPAFPFGLSTTVCIGVSIWLTATWLPSAGLT